jgi:class 3 adenylate cyclase
VIFEAASWVSAATRHGTRGTVNQFLGDGVMALFDGSLERNHAERALRAALAIECDLQTLRDDVRAAHGLQFNVRIAVNTGPVVIGAIGTGLRDDYIAVGNTTQLATHLLAVADAGQIVVSGRTHELTGTAFVYTPLRAPATDRARSPLVAWILEREARAPSSDTQRRLVACRES